MSLKKPIRKPTAEPEDEAPAPKKKGGSNSFADAFNSTPAGGGFDFPVGKWKAAVTSFTMDETEKGLSACIEYTGQDNDEDTVDDKTVKQYYKLADADGNAGPGIGFLKADLEKLGYSDVTFDDLPATLKEITREQPAVEIQVKKNGQYVNAYLQGVLAD